MTDQERQEMLEALHQALEAKFREVKSEVFLQRPYAISMTQAARDLRHQCTPQCPPNCQLELALARRKGGDAA